MSESTVDYIIAFTGASLTLAIGLFLISFFLKASLILSIGRALSISSVICGQLSYSWIIDKLIKKEDIRKCLIDQSYMNFIRVQFCLIGAALFFFGLVAIG